MLTDGTAKGKDIGRPAAGKTGTAEKAINGRYAKNRLLSATGAAELPTTILYDSKGKEVWRESGGQIGRLLRETLVTSGTLDLSAGPATISATRAFTSARESRSLCWSRERRPSWRAARIAERETVPAIIRRTCFSIAAGLVSRFASASASSSSSVRAFTPALTARKSGLCAI